MFTPEINNEKTPDAIETDQGQAPEQAATLANVEPGTPSGNVPATPHRGPVAPRPPFVPREERDRRRREALAQLKVGEWREGKVTGIAAFGAFVDLGGVDGLVHVSQLGTGGYVERVEDVVQVGQVVRVRVAEVDGERGRVSLSMREPRPAGAPGGPRDRPQPGPAAPRGPRPAPAPSLTTPAFSEAPPEGRHDRRTRTPREAPRDERPRREQQRPRRQRDTADEEWRSLRGDIRGYYSSGEDQDEEEPAPTTAEELVARFGRRDANANK